MRALPLLAGGLALLLSAPLHALSLDIPRPAPPGEDRRDLALSGLAIQPVLRAGAPVAIDPPLRAADWRSAGDGKAVWSLTLDSADARYLGLRLDGPQLPRGAELRLIGADGQTRGPFTADDLNDAGALWVPLVHGSRAVLELRAPAAATSEVRLGEVEAHYGLRRLDGGANTKAQGDAGDCHNDVACPEGDGWDSAIRSTTLLIIGNQLVCNGVLLNNTREDGDPLMITADHCGIRSDDNPEGFPADSVTAVFNFQAQQCDSNENVDQEDRIDGAELLYRDRRSDTSLIRLERAPPDAFGARFAGWDATGNGAASGSGVHHPSGDLKKISLFEQPLEPQTVTISGGGIRTGSQEVESWRVEWDDGVTEPGSSGSGIWNPQQRLLGVLSGGSSECASDGVLLGVGGNEENKGPDFYGRLAVAFDRAGELGTPLRAFLDPAGSGARSVNARGAERAPSDTPSDTPDSSDSADADGGDSGGGAFGVLGLLLLNGLARSRRRFSLFRT